MLIDIVIGVIMCIDTILSINMVVMDIILSISCFFDKIRVVIYSMFLFIIIFIIHSQWFLWHMSGSPTSVSGFY